MTAELANEKLVGDLRAAVQDAEELMRASAGQAGGKLREMRHRLAAAVDAAKATCRKMQEKTVATAKATDRCIRSHPYQTVGVALGLGLLAGILATRK